MKKSQVISLICALIVGLGTTYQFIKNPKNFLNLILAILLLSFFVYEVGKIIYYKKHKKM